MLKLITATSRIAALVGVLAALPGIVRVAELSKSAAHANAAAHGKGGGTLLDLVHEELAESVSAKSKPSQPITVIHYRGPDGSRGKSADAEGTDVTQLPPGANATIVDGRLQIYYPSSTSKKDK